MKTNNLKITLTGKEIKKLLNDKLKRTVNYKTKLYQCKVLKKCKTVVCTKKTRKKCTKKKNIKKKKGGKPRLLISGRRKKGKRGKKRKKKMKPKINYSLSTKQPFFRGSFIDFI